MSISTEHMRILKAAAQTTPATTCNEVAAVPDAERAEFANALPDPKAFKRFIETCAAPTLPAGEAKTTAPGAPRTFEAQVTQQATAEAAMQQVATIDGAKRLGKGGDSFKIRLHFSSGTEAMLKPNHLKWSKKEGVWGGVTKTYRPETAVYALGKLLQGQSQFVYPAIVDIDVPVDVLKKLDPSLFQVAKGMPKLANEGASIHCMAQEWVPGADGIGYKTAGSSRPGLKALAAELKTLAQKDPARLPYYRQVATLFMMDLLIGNNDRAGNTRYDVGTDRIYAINNDEGFVKPHQVGFAREAVAALSIVDGNTLAAMKDLFATHTDKQLASEIFSRYPADKALVLAKELRERYAILVKLTAKKPTF